MPTSLIEGTSVMEHITSKVLCQKRQQRELVAGVFEVDQPKLRDELIDAQKNGMLGEIIKNSVFRLLESYHKLAFIERARFRPLNWRIISL